MCELPFSIALWTIYTRSIFSLVLLKIFQNFRNTSRKKSTQKQLFSRVLQDRFLKKFANFTSKHQCWSHFLIKSPEKKRLQNRCFPVNFAKLLRTPFLQNTSKTCFSTNEVFWTPQHEERSVQSNYQDVNTKRCFCRFVGEIFRYEPFNMNYLWNIDEVACASGFEFLRNFLRIFEMYEFSEALFIKGLSYVYKVLVWSFYCYYEMLAYIDMRENGKRLVAYDK